MKKIIAAALAAIMLSAFLFGCGSEPTPAGDGDNSPTPPAGKQEVNVFNWGEYIDESLLDEFEAETGIKVNYQYYGTNEEMYSKLRSGGSDYDVIIPSDYMISRLIAEDMLAKLDFSNIPNYALIGGEHINREFDPTGEYAVPYMWGTVGIIYNTTLIEDEITSWDALFNPEYAGQIVMVDNPRDAFGIALKYLGYSLNTTDEDELNEAYELLVQQKSILQGYVTDDIFSKLEGANAAIGTYYAGDFITMYDVNPDLAYVLPEEGSNVFIDAMCVLKTAENKENAEKFINFMCSTEACLRNMEFTGYVSANDEAAELMREELDEELIEVLFPDEDTLSRCEVFLNLPQATLDLYDRLWLDVRS